MFSVERFALKHLTNSEIGASVAPSSSKPASQLFRLLDRPNDGVKIRPLAGLEFRMEQFAIGPNFEGAAARRSQGERLDTLAEFQNFRRQTDGFRRVVSNDAVFD